MSYPIISADAFALALSDVCERYMAHLEPSASPQQYAISMTVIGQQLNINFNKKPNHSPFIAFTLQSDEATAEDEQKRGLFR